MKIVLASLWAPVGVGAYLLRAAARLRRAGANLQVVTVGPTMGENCWGFKEFKFPAHAVWPDHELRRQAGDKSDAAAEQIDAVKTVLFKGGCDLWVDIDGGWFTDVHMPWPHAIVATDPHIAAEHGAHWLYERQRNVADFFFCMQKPYCEVTVSGGGCPGCTDTPAKVSRSDHHLPYAYDPEVFHPYPDQARDADVTVLGIPYTKRTRVAQGLQAAGFRVLAGMGTVYEAYARDLCRAPVCFIWSLKDDVPCRIYEAAACGAYIVCNDDIESEVIDLLGDHFDTFGGTEAMGSEDRAVQDAVRITCSVASNFDPRYSDKPFLPRALYDNRSAAAREEVKPHTWDERLRTIVRTALGKEIA